MKAIYVQNPGGAENLIYGDLPKPSPGPGHALVKLAAAGVNFIDIYFRTGLYKADAPITLGMEGAGTVESAGDGVTEVAAGDRVAYAMARGSYAEYAVVPAWQLVKIPAAVDFVSAAAAMLQGMTSHYLAYSTFELKPGDTCLIHAAAGGVGLILTQLAKNLGATVIGTAGSEAKLDLARAAGAAHGINYSTQDFAAEVKRITNGRGVDVVYDGVGAETFLKSLDCLRARGMMVSFGNASGAVPAIQPLILSQKGSLFLTRPTLFNYAVDHLEIAWRASDLFRWIVDGSLKLRIEHRYPLADAARAHQDLEGRKTTGKLVLEIQ
jgi:NADPH2:quinone reductase